VRKLSAILVSVFSCLLILALSRPVGSLPALAPLLNPFNGAMANAEPVNFNFTAALTNNHILDSVSVSFDNRLVPHIKAQNNHDLYFIQGYMHAYFRLWQMDMQTRAAAGNISEVVGESALMFDRTQRRKGMVFAAENGLKAAEADERSKEMLDAYTQGVNMRISELDAASVPLEYKLMSFRPSAWTNLRTILLLKYMADDLTGETDDLALTYLRDILDPTNFKLLFPEKITDSKPLIPNGTVFSKASLSAPAIPNDSVWHHFSITDFDANSHEDGIGSNNWALSGSKTASGAAILCNDPHLGLNLPSLWYEVQLTAPGLNVYGVSLPGCPGVVLGFNDSISWGFTNNYRDVKDFYAIKQVPNKNAYYMAGKELPFTLRPEIIKIKGKPDYIDTVRYTIQGPLMYDASFQAEAKLKLPLAMCWMAHRPSNEILSVYLLNRASSYNAFVSAIMYYTCPAQNIIYADRQGSIALWGQGQFVNKWKEQGRFVMNGADTAALWRQLIPMIENPHVLNPSQGYLCSANQNITDTSYPYYYNQLAVEFRAWRINEVLSNLKQATVNDMFSLQNDTHSILAKHVLPKLLTHLQQPDDDYISLLKKWDYNLAANSKAATVFQIWWYYFYIDYCNNLLHSHIIERFTNNKRFALNPAPEVVMQLLEREELQSQYGEHKRASNLLSYPQLVTNSYLKTLDSLKKLKAGSLAWYQAKNTTIKHLAKIPAFSYSNLNIGGWGNTVNAAKGNHGPSWRIVVQMGKQIDAYGVYPGGQSGNPGSPYYGNFINHWAAGNYYKLNFLHAGDTTYQSNIKYNWTISKTK
jgi:penicillin G amidase